MDFEKPTDVEYNALTDAELWLAVGQGRTEALGVLYDRHAGLVYGIACKLLGNAQEAEDLTQDIFVKMVSQSAYDPRRGSLRTFLAILTRSRAIDRVRSRQRDAQRIMQLGDTPHPTTPGKTSLEEIVQAEQNQAVRAALALLPDNQQQLLKMSYYDGLTQAKISEQLNLPLGTVKSGVRRGLLKLRQILEDRLDQTN